MDLMPWQAIIFQAIPEGIILVSLSLGLLGIYPPFKSIPWPAVLFSLCTVTVRSLPIPFGVHSLLIIPILTLILVIFFGAHWWKALVSVLLASIIFVFAESILIPVLLNITGYELQTVMHDPWLRVLFPLPEETLIGCLAFVLWKKRLALFRPDKPQLYPKGEGKGRG